MAVARRTRLMPPVEPSVDNSPTEVVFEDEGNEAQVIEQIGGKTVQYNAKVKRSETKDQDNVDAFEDFEGIDEIEDYPQIPQSQLDKMFADVQWSVANENMYDIFFAKLVRQPDAINDKFNIPCRDIIEIGVVQFSSTDRFRFIPAIQEMNGNSGGRFSISIYDSEYKEFATMRNMTYKARPVGLILTVTNPQPKPIENTNGNSPNNFESALMKVAEMNQQNHNQLIQILNRKPEKSGFEIAFEQKMYNEMLNPPQNHNNSATDIIAGVMQSIAVTQAMGDAIARGINREPPPPPEKTWIDQLNEASENPMLKKLGEKAIDFADNVASNLAVKALNLPTEGFPNGQPQQTQPQPQPTMQPEIQELDETQELTLDIIGELAGTNPLDASNKMIKSLAVDYPDQFQLLVATCKGASFEFVFDQLIKRTSNIQPSPFIDYLDLEQTNIQQRFVYNDAGTKLVDRLKLLYEYLRTIS